MWKYPIRETLFDKFSKYSKITGFIFIILGLVGIIYPVFMTLATVSFVAWLMVLGGIMAGYFTFLSDKNDYLGWLKSFILTGIGLFILYHPLSAIGTVGLLLAIYFFMDFFAGFSLALSMRPEKGWLLWMINAIFSLIIGIFFIVGWPFTSEYLIGLVVGFSLFFDGIALLVTGVIFKNMKGVSHE